MNAESNTLSKLNTIVLPTDKKICLDTFVHAFCFISVLLIGADIWGVNVGVNFRIDQVFLVIFTLLLWVKNSYRITDNRFVLIFAVSSLISVFLAFNVLRGALFYFSILYNIFFLFFAFSSYVKTYGIKKFTVIFRWTFYVQFALLIMQFALKVVLKFEFSFLPSYGEYMGIPRFSLWFYEPSYLATYAIFWFAFSCYMLIMCNQAKYFIDAILGFIMLAITTSSTGFIGIALVVAVVYLMWFFRGITLKKFITLFIIIGVIVALRFIFSSVFDVFIARLFNGDINQASGGRVEQWSETFKVFLEHPVFGVGPGNYGLYLGEDAGYVPSNVTLELMATLGIVGTVAFYGLTVSLIVKSIKVSKKVKNNQSKMLVACAFALIIFTVILQANQGYLRLYHWMLLGVIYGGIKYLKGEYLR